MEMEDGDVAEKNGEDCTGIYRKIGSRYMLKRTRKEQWQLLDCEVDCEVDCEGIRIVGLTQLVIRWLTQAHCWRDWKGIPLKNG